MMSVGKYDQFDRFSRIFRTIFDRRHEKRTGCHSKVTTGPAFQNLRIDLFGFAAGLCLFFGDHRFSRQFYLVAFLTDTLDEYLLAFL